jgi:hypothetical protein
MKKLLLTSATGLAMLASAPAYAEETRCTSPVCAHVDFEKSTWVYELQLKLKVALIVVAGVHAGPYAAESNAVVYQNNDNGTVNTDGSGTSQFQFVLTAKIDDSVNKNKGITQFNQDVGNFANQMNVVSLAVNKTGGFSDANASAQQNNGPSTTVNSTEVVKTATILSSVNGNSGITMVNQNAGNFNNQANVASIAVSGTGANGAVVVDGLKGGTPGSGDPGGNILALSEADLGQSNRGTSTTERNVRVISFKDSLIDKSVNGNTGITAVNQAAGNFNNQATVISLSGSVKF